VQKHTIWSRSAPLAFEFRFTESIRQAASNVQQEHGTVPLVPPATQPTIHQQEHELILMLASINEIPQLPSMSVCALAPVSQYSYLGRCRPGAQHPPAWVPPAWSGQHASWLDPCAPQSPQLPPPLLLPQQLRLLLAWEDEVGGLQVVDWGQVQLEGRLVQAPPRSAHV
jgi:hypothetical protein